MTDTFGGEFTTKRLLALLVLGAGMLIVFGAMARIPNATMALNTYVGLYLAAFALYLLAAKMVSSLSGFRMLVVICLFALLFRIVLFPVRPTISTDIYRYVWDGRVQAEGINPYRYAPASPQLAHLRGPEWFWINHRKTHTPYPPVSQLVFTAVTRLFGSTVYPLKTLFVLCDLATIAILGLMLRHLRIPSGSSILYAWSPLIVTEFSGAGHQDSMGIMLLLLALYLLIRRRQSWLPGILLAASSLVKPYPLLAAPILARKDWVRLPSTLLITSAILCLPYIGARTHWLSGIADYGFKWHRDDSLFALISSGLALATDHHEAVARVIVLLGIVAISVLMALRRSSDEKSLIQGVFTVLAVGFLLSPTVYPWYLAWAVPFLCIIRSPGWLLFTGLAALCYVIPIYGEPAIRLITYLPVYMLLLLPILPARLRFWERPMGEPDRS